MSREEFEKRVGKERLEPLLPSGATLVLNDAGYCHVRLENGDERSVEVVIESLEKVGHEVLKREHDGVKSADEAAKKHFSITSVDSSTTQAEEKFFG
jgi:hypothetical protein